jgi:hypothetical protein
VVMMPLDTTTAENKPNTIKTEFKSNILKWILSLSIVHRAIPIGLILGTKP